MSIVRRSKDPDILPHDDNLAAQALDSGAPAMLRKGRLAQALYSRSLGIAPIASAGSA